ncbi:MatE family transporter [Orrella sp. JC864]
MQPAGEDARTAPGLGPSDSTDSASDVPAGQARSDSDATGTGERESADPLEDIEDGADIDADAVVDEDQAGLSHTRPDPVRNGTVEE